MPILVVEKLLILQDRDKSRRDLEAQLHLLPREVAAVEAKIASEKGAIEASRTEMKELETKKKLIETEIGSAEQRVAKYRTQQLEVRKNDEYRALGHEIETVQAQISQLEEQELGIMYAIDEAKKKFTTAESVLKENISGHEGRIRMLREREISVKQDLIDAQAKLLEARQPLEETTLRLYDRISQRSFPACVPVNGGKCGGCHLKVSSEVESACRGKDGKLATCDQCTRIVWWES
jgi:uncharacterized protein